MAGLQQLVDVMAAFQKLEGLSHLDRIQSDRRINADDALAEDSLGFGRSGAKTPRLIRFRVEAVGSDLVVTAKYGGQQLDVYRTVLAAAHFDGSFVERVEQLLLQQVRDCLR